MGSGESRGEGRGGQRGAGRGLGGLSHLRGHGDQGWQEVGKGWAPRAGWNETVLAQRVFGPRPPWSQAQTGRKAGLLAADRGKVGRSIQSHCLGKNQDDELQSTSSRQRWGAVVVGGEFALSPVSLPASHQVCRLWVGSGQRPPAPEGQCPQWTWEVGRCGGGGGIRAGRHFEPKKDWWELVLNSRQRKGEVVAWGRGGGRVVVDGQACAFFFSFMRCELKQLKICILFYTTCLAVFLHLCSV